MRNQEGNADRETVAVCVEEKRYQCIYLVRPKDSQIVPAIQELQDEVVVQQIEAMNGRHD